MHFASMVCHNVLFQTQMHDGIKIDLSSAFHLQTEGVMERVNGILKQMFHIFLNPKQDNWDESLHAIKFACNNTIHDDTGYTPFNLKDGGHLATPLDVKN